MTVSSLVKGGFGEADVARELLQYEIIRGIFVKSTEREIALKGGFAMRALFGSARRTKDIDLHQDASKASLARTQTLIRSAIRSALSSGMLTDVRISEPKQTDTVARWKIGGRTHQGSVIHLTVEVSRRPMPRTDCLTRLPMPASGQDKKPETRFVMVDTYSADTMAASKTVALLSENRVAPRDLWDLDILISMQAEPPPHMIDHLRNEHSRELLFDKMELMTWDLFQSEVLPTLPDEVAKAITPDDFEAMKIRVALAVERWLDGPTSVADPQSVSQDCEGPAPS